MTLAALRKRLEEITLPGDTEIYLQRDSEGNGFEFLQGIDDESFILPNPHCPGEINVFCEEDLDELDDDVRSTIKRCLIVYP